MVYALKVFFVSNKYGLLVIQKKSGNRLSLIKEKIGFFRRCSKSNTLFVTVNHTRLSFWLGKGASFSKNRLLATVCYGKH
jgi:ribosomal protein S16